MSATTIKEQRLKTKRQQQEPMGGASGEPDDHTESEARPVSLLSAYQKHLNALKRSVLRIVNVESDVDDVVQEAFMRAYKAEAKGAAIRQPKSYLFRVARHVALDQLRHKINRPTDFLEDSEPATVLAGEWTVEDEVLAQERLGIHCAAVAALPPRRRKVYLLRKVYGMSHKQIADSLDITVSTVEAHLVKAFRQCHDYVRSRTEEGVLGADASAAQVVRPERLRKKGLDNG